MKILAIGGSNSKNSINKQLANYTASLFSQGNVSEFDISQIDLPLFSVDLESAIEFPKCVLDFAKKIDETDLIILSLAEHNGTFSVGFKNLLDWTSRIKGRKIFGEKKMLLMATSPGGRGGLSVLESAISLFPRFGTEILHTFSLPSFHENFSSDLGITNEELNQKVKYCVAEIEGGF